jgi:hypothetical protein
VLSDVRGEVAVLALGTLLWVGGTFATGEMGRALTGGGMVFCTIGLVLVAIALIRRAARGRLDEDRSKLTS